MNRRLVIVQPYVPEYRQPFFELLIQSLKSEGTECVVAAGQPRGKQSLRADSSTAEWLVPVSSRELRIAGKSLNLGGSRPAWKSADAVILGHEGSSLDVYRALLGSNRTGQRIGLWGHIGSYVSRHHPVDAALESWQLHRADHIFAYTSSGARFAIEAGASRFKVTNVMNSVATEGLLATARGLTAAEINAFRLEHALEKGKTYAFVGGLDSSKRIDFLSEALNHLWNFDPTVRVIVGGEGDQSHLLNLAVDRGQAIMIGRAGARDLAMIGRLAEAILMPGRIGLIAVEALALGIPVITTDWPYHAPEAEYLSEGVSMFTTPNDPESYARFVSKRLSRTINSMGDCDWAYPSLAGMVDNFSRGVRSLLA